MSGNVFEWTRSAKRDYPYMEDEERQNSTVSPQVLRMVRGGAFGSSSGFARCAYRVWYSPDYRDGDMGFRVVLSPFPL
jgi:formylglycine-generating enzyme required for sulfatase activity